MQSTNDLQVRAAAAKYVFYSLSGGRDSQAALELTHEHYKRQGKIIEALYVDSTNEMESVTAHVVDIANRAGLRLVRIPGKDFIAHYTEKGRWPNSIHKDCIEAMINRPLDAYCRERAQGEDYILVRGGRATQRNRYSGSAELQEVKTKPGMIIHNPLYAQPDYAPRWPVWPGYAEGYARTRCWCCPFALVSDWEIMREKDRDKWEHMRQMFGTLSWRAYRGDGYLRRIKSYWEDKHGVTIPYTYPARKNE